MDIERITGRSTRGGLITETVNAAFTGSVSEALKTYFPGATIDGGDSPYELAIYGANDEDLGVISLTAKEAHEYLAGKYDKDRATAILNDYEGSFGG